MNANHIKTLDSLCNFYKEIQIKSAEKKISKFKKKITLLKQIEINQWQEYITHLFSKKFFDENLRKKDKEKLQKYKQEFNKNCYIDIDIESSSHEQNNFQTNEDILNNCKKQLKKFLKPLKLSKDRVIEICFCATSYLTNKKKGYIDIIKKYVQDDHKCERLFESFDQIYDQQKQINCIQKKHIGNDSDLSIDKKETQKMNPMQSISEDSFALQYLDGLNSNKNIDNSLMDQTQYFSSIKKQKAKKKKSEKNNKKNNYRSTQTIPEESYSNFDENSHDDSSELEKSFVIINHDN